MIRHCVFLRFRPAVDKAERTLLFGEIAALKGRLPGILAVHSGPNVSPETGMDKGFAEGFIVDFADAAARDLYLADPDHQRIGMKLVAASEGGVAGIMVFDLDMPGTA